MIKKQKFNRNKHYGCVTHIDSKLCLGQRFHQHALNALKHCVWVLIGVDVLWVCVEIGEFVHVGVVASESLLHRGLLVAGIHHQSFLDLLCWRGVVEDVVALPGHWVGRSQRQSLNHRVVGNIEAEYPKTDVLHNIFFLYFRFSGSFPDCFEFLRLQVKQQISWILYQTANGTLRSWTISYNSLKKIVL